MKIAYKGILRWNVRLLLFFDPRLSSKDTLRDFRSNRNFENLAESQQLAAPRQSNDFIHLKISVCGGKRWERRNINFEEFLRKKNQDIYCLFVKRICPEN